MKRRKNGLLFFLSSCIPGCGQMHLGYMKRGLSLMLAFWGLFFVSAFLEMDMLLVFIIPAWLYSFFDSYNLRARIEDDIAEVDAFLFGLDAMEGEQLTILIQKRHAIIGWTLVALGVWTLYRRAMRCVLNMLEQYFDIAGWFYHLFRFDIPRLVVTAGIIALGVWFIRGPKKTAAPENDIPSFVPPRQEVNDGEE